MIAPLHSLLRFGRPARGPAVAALALALAAAAWAAPPREADPFPQARARGLLVVGVPYLAPPAAAGAKVRTPERLDTVMAERLGARLGLPVKVVQVEPARRGAVLADGSVDLLLADRVAGQSAPGLEAPGVALVPTGYAARPKAVIRSDTPMRRWQDARGRSVCMASAAFQAQALAARWGTVVRTFRVPSDALVAVREGACDIGLVDDTTWAALMKFPEWKKFSATLPPDGPPAERVWLARAGDGAAADWLAAAMADWRNEGAWQAMAGKWAREVAFDVYLDQEVPDCHGG